jgi:hypothetical protein
MRWPRNFAVLLLPGELERSVQADRSRTAAIVKAFNITFD